MLQAPMPKREICASYHIDINGRIDSIRIDVSSYDTSEFVKSLEVYGFLSRDTGCDFRFYLEPFGIYDISEIVNYINSYNDAQARDLSTVDNIEWDIKWDL